MTTQRTYSHPEGYLTLQEAAERYHVSVGTLRRRIRTGALPAVRSGVRLIRGTGRRTGAPVQARAELHLVGVLTTFPIPCNAAKRPWRPRAPGPLARSTSAPRYCTYLHVARLYGLF